MTVQLKVSVNVPPTADLEEYLNDILENFLEDGDVLTPQALEELHEIAYEILTDNVDIEIKQEVV